VLAAAAGLALPELTLNTRGRATNEVFYSCVWKCRRLASCRHLPSAKS